MQAGELAQAAEIFHQAFSEEHARRYRSDARAVSFADIWTFIRNVEPRGFLAARDDGRLVGYAIFIPSLKRLQRRAIASGAIFRWAIAALRGRFGLRVAALPRILANKIFFAANARRYRHRGDAQLLNIAVKPGEQGRGAGEALVKAGLAIMRELNAGEVRLEVRPWNRRAVRLYERTGWREVGRTRDLEGEWLVMTANS